MLKHVPWRGLRARVVLIGWALAFIAFVPAPAPAGTALDERVLGKARDYLYNYVSWELEAILFKIRQAHSSLAPFTTETERARFVIRYLDAVRRADELNGQIDRVFADPNQPDKTQAFQLTVVRDAVVSSIKQYQPLAEAIIEGQIGAVLRDEGFAVLGEVIPPVSARITDLPMLLVISPRNVIRRDLAINLINLTPDQMAALEAEIDHDFGVSSLVVPIGGLALYPSMVIRSGHAPYLYETIAHEWAHHYLLLFPLGFEYLNTGSETWIINETVASVFGREIGRKTIERFYADFPEVLRLLPASQSPRLPRSASVTPTPSDPPRFNAGAVMNETRVRADQLLAEGKIEEAEAYLEQQRRLFAANGYVYRKMNQAFFAFYGGYQAPDGSGAGGQDPIGPAVSALREGHPSIKAWMETVRGITSRTALLEAVQMISRK